MKQTSRIISTCSADTFGVCSALFELGGMVIMHDASGCNSTYTTHDEPRWYDMDSMVYISGLSEMEAILGDDEKLISDIVAAAEELHPKFIAMAGTPIPAMTGFDYDAVANLIEERTGIPAFGFPTTGMETYVRGASMALGAIARRFVWEGEKTAEKSVNILGLTPLDFSVNGSEDAIARRLEDNGWRVLSRWAMGSSLEELSKAAGAHVNLVVSASGLEAAKVLKKRFGTPYVLGVPYGEAWAAQLLRALEAGEQNPVETLAGGDILLLGEGVSALSLASALEAETGRGVRVLCFTECPDGILRDKDLRCTSEEEIEAAIRRAKTVIADPMFAPVVPETVKFVSLPMESVSGRIYRTEIPNLVTEFETWLKEVM